MKLLLCVIYTFLLFSCSSVDPPVSGAKFKYGNDCLPQAIIMTESLKEKDIESKVIVLQTYNFTHAVSTYMYPKGKNQLWVWDRDWRSIRLNAWKDSPHSVSRAWLKITHPSEILKTAEYLE